MCKNVCDQNNFSLFWIDKNECLATHECHYNAQCINNHGSYMCICYDGFTGTGFQCTGLQFKNVYYTNQWSLSRWEVTLVKVFIIISSS